MSAKKLTRKELDKWQASAETLRDSGFVNVDRELALIAHVRAQDDALREILRRTEANCNVDPADCECVAGIARAVRMETE